jgi:hypothetical protein
MRYSPTARRMSSLREPDATTEGATTSRRNWDAVAAVVAALIGFLALSVSGYTAYIQRQQVRAQVWPWLIAGNNDHEHSIAIYNKGVGPAIVRDAQVFVDDKPQTSWHRVIDALGIAPPNEFYQSTINPNVLSPGEEVTMIRFTEEDAWHRFRTAATSRMSMDICFCSTLDECWMYSDRQPVGYKLSTQLVTPVDRCPHLAEGQEFKN